LHPEDHRDGRRARRRRSVDAQPAAVVHRRAVPLDPDAGRWRMNQTQETASQLLAAIGVRNVIGFFLVLARVAPLFLVAPLFSSRQVPARAKTIVALAFTLGLYPLAVAGQTLPTEVAEIVGLIVKELLVGLAFALCIALLFAAIETAGSLLDFMVGFA